MSSSSSYEGSVLDWGSLRAHARRAAENAGNAPRPAHGYLRPTGCARWSANYQGDREAIEVVGPHWVLHEAIEMRRNESGTTEEEEDSWMAIVLLTDGRLQCLYVSDETKWIKGGELSVWRAIGHTARDVLEYDVTRLDFEMEWVMNSGVPGQWFGDRGRGALLYPTKGAGLAAALERVIRGDPKTATVEKTNVIKPMDELRREAESSRPQAPNTTPSTPTNPRHLNEGGYRFDPLWDAETNAIYEQIFQKAAQNTSRGKGALDRHEYQCLARSGSERERISDLRQRLSYLESRMQTSVQSEPFVDGDGSNCLEYADKSLGLADWALHQLSDLSPAYLSQQTPYQQPYGQHPAGYGAPYQPAPQPYPGAAYPALPVAGQLATWGTRALGGLIDYVAPALVFGLMASPFAPGVNPSTGAISGGNQALYYLLNNVLPIAFWVYNSGWKQGTTGRTFGKQVAKTRLISEATGQPIGFGLAVVRHLCHLVDSLICLVGWLFPLWDPKRQTIADKIMKTVVVRDA